MKKGTIVYIDGISCHLGEIDHAANIYGDEYYIFTSVSIDGEYVENYCDNDYEAYEEGFIAPIECCKEASAEDVEKYNVRKQHKD